MNEYRNNITKIDVDAVDPVKVGGNVYSQNIVGYVNRSTNLSIFLSNASADQGKQLITFPGLAVPEAFRRRMSEWFHEQAVLPLGGKENP